MHQETEMIVSAIESLKQDPNYFKDYIFPIASAFFTAILGAFIAHMTMGRQEGLKLEKDKLIAANKWTLDVERARSSLVAIKGNYHKQLQAAPIQRLSSIPSILMRFEPIAEDYQDLAFIVPSEEEHKKQPQKWAQIPRINTMIGNYNVLLHMWKKRNEINEAFKKTILDTYGNRAFANITMQEAEQAFGGARLVSLIDVTEMCIKLSDHIIIELNDFLENFPKYATTKIDLKRLKNFGKLISYSNNENELLLEIIKPEVEVDFSSVQNLYGESVQDIKQRHTTGYE